MNLINSTEVVQTKFHTAIITAGGELPAHMQEKGMFGYLSFRANLDFSADFAEYHDLETNFAPEEITKDKLLIKMSLKDIIEWNDESQCYFFNSLCGHFSSDDKAENQEIYIALASNLFIKVSVYLDDYNFCIDTSEDDSFYVYAVNDYEIKKVEIIDSFY